MRKKGLLFIALVNLAIANFVYAQADADNSIRIIATEVMSPFCPGKLLEDCPSAQASQLKAQMLDQLKSGKSSSEVKQWFISRYGEEMLAAPEARGFGLLVWLMPLVFCVIGVGLLVRWIARHKASHFPVE